MIFSIMMVMKTAATPPFSRYASASIIGIA